MENFHFFWGGPLSQWAKSNFVIDGVMYVTAEQYMMAQKALLFKDYSSYNDIMLTTSPLHQKRIGRSVKDFNKEVWESVAKDIVYRANYAKFTQNVGLYDYLMSTNDKVLVEASPDDKIWGIGLFETDPRALDRNQWLGTNWLGEILTNVREDIKKEKSNWLNKISL